MALYKTVSAEYLATTGVHLLRGRWFTTADIATPGNGIVVSETVARRYWPNENPIGRSITVFRSSQARPDFGQPEPGIVIGVVGDVRHFGVAEVPTPEVYVPYTREVWPHIALVVRTAADPEATIPALRRAVLAVDPAIPVAGSAQLAGFQPMSRFLSQSLATRRYATRLLAGFAACALLLAILGALAFTRVLGSLLYETSPTDPVTFLAVAGIVVATALVASVLPARRAARIDPILSLRSE